MVLRPGRQLDHQSASGRARNSRREAGRAEAYACLPLGGVLPDSIGPHRIGLEGMRGRQERACSSARTSANGAVSMLGMSEGVVRAARRRHRHSHDDRLDHRDHQGAPRSDTATSKTHGGDHTRQTATRR
jgi:hypothetical protein